MSVARSAAAPAGRGARPEVDTVLTQARRALVDGENEQAWDRVESAIRSGLWHEPRLWAELLSMLASPADYPRLRALWLASPGSCHTMVGVIRVVARAASAGGAHGEARSLLRKAILQQSRYRRRTRSALGRTKRRVRAFLPRRAPGIGQHQVHFARRAATALADMDHELTGIGARVFLISGTLLGCVREGGFIGWDKDIDVGYFTEETTPADLENAFRRSPSFLVRRLDFNSTRLRVNHSNGIMIDIFPHYPGSDGRIWHDGTATRWWNSPFGLRAVEFLGRPQLLPDPPERYLDENYGDWRVPRPDFDARLDTPNVEVTDPEYFDTLLYFSLLDAIGKGNRRRRRRYAALLADRGEGTWLRRVP